MIKTLAEFRQRDNVRLEFGDVIARSGEAFRLSLGDATVSARRASGCVMEPEPGDRVLAAVAGHEGFIITVLERTSDRPTKWSVSGDLDLNADGALNLRGREVNLEGAAQVSLRSPRMLFQAWSAVMEFMTTVWRGRAARADLETIRTSADSVDLKAGRLVTRARRVFRRIKEFEETRAGRLRTLVEGRWSLRSREAKMRGERVIDLDSDKIHLG